MVQITEQQLSSIFGGNTTKFEVPINNTLNRFRMTDKISAACFLAQIGHESANLTRFKENLNYSEHGLLSTFGKYFTPFLAKEYERQPEKIANRVYANRMGNGPESSGDGWKFRGRGAIQITGKNNYVAFAKFMERSLDDTIAYLETDEGAIYSAGWFFAQNGLVPLAESGDMKTLTRKINGGYNGLNDRIALYKKILSAFG